MKHSLALGIVLILGSLSSEAGAADPDRPLNILFCFADDWGRYAGAYAPLAGRPTPSDVVKTPHIDRVAREGALFRNAFVCAPSCTPCRSALLSGRYFFRTGRGAILNGAIWDSSIPSFPLLLRDSGYHIGKTHKVWSPGMPADAPFGGQKYAWQKAGSRYNNYSEQVTALIQAGAELPAAREQLLREVRGNFDAFLAARKDAAPWMYWFGPTNVHRTWVKGSGKTLWGIEPNSLAGKLPKFLPDVPEVREDFADYLGETQAFDAYVGELIEQLAAAGELERTVIIVSGDHGAPGFTNGKCNLYDFGVGVALVARVPGRKGGRVIDDFVNLMDLMPTFLEIGGVSTPEGVDGRSLWPLLNSEKQGQIDPERTFVVTGRERHVGAARAGNLPYPQRALRIKDWLYIRNFEPDRWPMGDPGEVTQTNEPTPQILETETRVAFADMDAGPTKAWLVKHRHEADGQRFFNFAFGKRPKEELYDVKADPDQIVNLADDPAYLERRQTMWQDLLRQLKDDPRQAPGEVIFEHAPFTN